MRQRFTLSLAALLVVSVATAFGQEDVARQHIQQGIAYVSAGDTIRAISEFERAVDIAPRFADAHYQLGRLYTEIASVVETDYSDRVKAEGALLEALRLSPYDPRYLLELARLRLKQHMRIDAARLFDRALSEAEKLGDADVLADVHFHIGYIRELRYRALENRRFTPFFKGPPHDQFGSLFGMMGVQGPARYGNEYLNETQPIQGAGQLYREEMVEHYRAALRYSPAHVGANVRLMGQLLDEHRLAEYLAHARRLSAAHPERPEPYLYMGLGMHVAGREEEAAEAFSQGLERLPDRARAAVESLAEVMRREQAEQYLDLSDEEREDFERTYWQLADPLILTTANEKRLEHLARVAYADLRFAAPEAALRGWETDQGVIYVRYGPPRQIASFAPQTYDAGNPYTVGRRSIIWSYGDNGPVFVFSQMPGYLNARFAGDYKFIADNYRHLQPAVYNNIPSIPELLDLPIQVARFRGSTPEEVALEVHAALPLVSLARDLDLETGEFETGMFLLNSLGVEVVRDVTTELVTYAESEDLNEYRSWRVILPPGDELVAAVETRDAVTWRAAAAREPFIATAFPADSLSISDILMADAARPLIDDPQRRADYEVFPNAGLRYEPGDAIHVYYEVYGLATDVEGYAHFDVSLQLRVKRLKRGGGIAALIGALADAWGFSIKGDDRLELQFSRQVRLDGRDRVTEYLSLDPQELPLGEYEIRLRIWDGQAERLASRLRGFQVIESDERE